MNERNRFPSPHSVYSMELRTQLIEYWNAIATCDELSGALLSLVRDTEIRVTELLATCRDDDLNQAQRITAAFEYKRQQSS